MSCLICDGGGAITAGAGSVSLGLRFVTCSGADTGGGITATACEPGTRIGVMSLRGALGLGGTIAAFKGGAERILSRCGSGVGGTMLAFSIGARCALLLSLRTSGVGATTA